MDPIQERIKYYTELFKVLWLTMVADVGGIIGLILGPAWQWKVWAIISGAFVAAVFLSLAVVLHFMIIRLIGRAEERRC